MDDPRHVRDFIPGPIVVEALQLPNCTVRDRSVLAHVDGADHRRQPNSGSVRRTRLIVSLGDTDDFHGVPPLGQRSSSVPRASLNRLVKFATATVSVSWTSASGES